jgi:hypothetical protein
MGTNQIAPMMIFSAKTINRLFRLSDFGCSISYLDMVPNRSNVANIAAFTAPHTATRVANEDVKKNTATPADSRAHAGTFIIK